MAQVYVSVDGGPEAPFTSGQSGSAPAPWIQVGKTYEFRLYAGTEHATLLSKQELHEKAIEYAQQAAGPEGSRDPTALHTLATLYADLGRSVQSIPFFNPTACGTSPSSRSFDS